MRAFALVTAALVLTACQRAPTAEDRAAPPASASISKALPPASAGGPAVALTKNPYAGRWSGTYEAALERVVLPVGGIRAWKEDDGAAGAGKGTLSVEVSADGSARGEATGPLGAQTLRGIADEHGLRLTLAPKEPDVRGFSGTLVAAKSADRVTGQLRASSGDSLVVRKASVELRPSGS